MEAISHNMNIMDFPRAKWLMCFKIFAYYFWIIRFIAIVTEPEPPTTDLDKIRHSVQCKNVAICTYL